MPLFVALPVVVPLTEEPVVVPGAVVTPGEVVLPVVLDCANASVLVNASAAASPSVAILMGYSFFKSNPQRHMRASVPAQVVTIRSRSRSSESVELNPIFG